MDKTVGFTLPSALGGGKVCDTVVGSVGLEVCVRVPDLNGSLVSLGVWRPEPGLLLIA